MPPIHSEWLPEAWAVFAAVPMTLFTLVPAAAVVTFHVAAGVEAQFMQAAARDRWPVLMAIFCFDVASYTLRVAARGLAGGFAAVPVTLFALYPQLLNMAVLYIVIHWINRRSRKATGQMWAAVQVRCRSGRVLFNRVAIHDSLNQLVHGCVGSLRCPAPFARAEAHHVTQNSISEKLTDVTP